MERAHPPEEWGYEESMRLEKETHVRYYPRVLGPTAKQQFKTVWDVRTEEALTLENATVAECWETLKVMDPEGAGQWDADRVLAEVQSFRSGADRDEVRLGEVVHRQPSVQSITGKPLGTGRPQAGDRVLYAVALQAGGAGAEYRYVEIGDGWNVPVYDGDVLQFDALLSPEVLRTPATARKDHRRQKRVYLFFSHYKLEAQPPVHPPQSTLPAQSPLPTQRPRVALMPRQQVSQDPQEGPNSLAESQVERDIQASETLVPPSAPKAEPKSRKRKNGAEADIPKACKKLDMGHAEQVKIVDLATVVDAEDMADYLKYIGRLMGSTEPATLVEKFRNDQNISVHVMTVRGRVEEMAIRRLQAHSQGFSIKWYDDAQANGQLSSGEKR